MKITTKKIWITRDEDDKDVMVYLKKPKFTSDGYDDQTGPERADFFIDGINANTMSQMIGLNIQEGACYQIKLITLKKEHHQIKEG